MGLNLKTGREGLSHPNLVIINICTACRAQIRTRLPSAGTRYRYCPLQGSTTRTLHSPLGMSSHHMINTSLKFPHSLFLLSYPPFHIQHLRRLQRAASCYHSGTQTWVMTSTTDTHPLILLRRRLGKRSLFSMRAWKCFHRSAGRLEITPMIPNIPNSCSVHYRYL